MSFDFDRLNNAEVVDQNGEKIGHVGQIYLDDATNQPTFVTVKTGLFGTRETFVPLNNVDTNADVLRVPFTKEFVKDAPNVDADGHITEAEQDEIYRYYQLNGTTGYAGTDRDAVAGTERRDVVDTDRRDLGTDRSADNGEMIRREEELHVGTQRVETGQVRLRKHVVTEQQTVTVPVQREEVQVVRETIADGTPSNARLGEGDAEQVVTLSEERPVVEKTVVDKERVGLQTNTVTEQQQVTAEVGREEIVVENDTTRDAGLKGKAEGLKDRIEDKFDRK